MKRLSVKIVKKGLINVIILALVLVNLILTIILVFSFVPTINKTSNLVDKIATIIDLDVGDSSGDGEDGVIPVSDLENVSVTFDSDTETTVSLKLDEGSTSAHYVKLSAVLSIDTTSADYSDLRDSIDSAMSLINSIVIDVVGSYTYSTIDKDMMQNEIKDELNKLFNTDFIITVSFNQFLIQ